MSKRKKILLMLARGGASQSEVAAALHASKRDVSACARAIRERGLAFDAIAAMTAAEVDEMMLPPNGKPVEGAYLIPDMAPLVERRKGNRKLTVKMFWMEHCEAAAAADRLAYSYQTFCEMFSDAAERAGARRRLAHEPGAKAYVDWAGDTASLTDRLTGARAKIYVIVVALPYSDRFWAQGFADMRQRSWQEGAGPRPRGLRRGPQDARARQRRHGDGPLLGLRHARERRVPALRRALRGGGRPGQGPPPPRQGGRRVHGRPRREVGHRPPPTR